MLNDLREVSCVPGADLQTTAQKPVLWSLSESLRQLIKAKRACIGGSKATGRKGLTETKSIKNEGGPYF